MSPSLVFLPREEDCRSRGAGPRSGLLSDTAADLWKCLQFPVGSIRGEEAGQAVEDQTTRLSVYTEKINHQRDIRKGKHNLATIGPVLGHQIFDFFLI